MPLLTFLAAALVLASHARGQSDGLTVSTKEGDVTGTLISAGVRQFLGIPYAVAGRWEAPKAAPTRSTTLSATQYGDSCIQSLTPYNLEFLSLAGVPTDPIPESEDCLSVNVWAPTTVRKQNTAVMVFVYGGSFTFGSSNTNFYNGTSLVQGFDDVTVVTLNYRLNIFGQPNSPQLASSTESQNFGLLDLDAAVQWVYDNIASFGGDPERITLFGQSAGSAAIDAYTFAHPTDTRVKAVIEESGTLELPIFSTPSQPGQPDPQAWNKVAGAVGCGTTTDATQLQCMKAVPFRTLEDAVISSGASFTPLPDDITIPFDVSAQSADGNFLKVPILAGTTAQEGDSLIVALELVKLGFTIPVATQTLSDVVTKSFFTCPAGNTARDRTKVVPTWRYQYQAVFPNISKRTDLRAFHASELPIVFGTYTFNTPPQPTTAEVTLSKYIQGAWVSFARDPANGLTNYGWPTYQPTKNTVAQLGGSGNQTGVTFTTGTAVDTGCTAVETVEDIVKLISKLTGINIPISDLFH